MGEATPDVGTPEGIPVPPETMSGVDEAGGHALHWTVEPVARTVVRAAGR